MLRIAAAAGMESGTNIKQQQKPQRQPPLLATCRVCLSNTTKYNKLTERLPQDEEVEIEEKGDSKAPPLPKTYFEYFVAVTQLKLDPLELDLPQQICGDCSAELCASYRFQRRAQQADVKLRCRTTSKFVLQNEESQLSEDLKANTNKGVSEATCTKGKLLTLRRIANSSLMKLSSGFDATHEKDQKSSAANDELNECSNCQMDIVEDDAKISISSNAAKTTQFSADNTATKCKPGAEIECKVCKRLFSSAKYATHFRKVHADAPNGFPCPKCSKHFAYRYRLKSHFEVHHGVRQKNVACSECPKMFYSKKLLGTHMLSHGSADIRHKCSECGKGFQRVTGLRRHMIMHDGGREQCAVCDKRFPNHAELRIHMLTHTNETPFLCAICGQGFRRQGPLSYHMRKHRGEKYTCAHCSQEFTCLSSMRRHEYIHTGLPFQCPRCATRQATRGSLERHVKVAHQAALTADELREIYGSVQNSRLQ